MKYPTESPKKAAAWLFDKGANVLSLDGKSPEPIGWKPWQTKRQDLEQVKDLPWHRGGTGVICGISNFRCLDFDGTEEGVQFGSIEKVLDTWDFPHRYPWIVESGSGNGYHLWFRCEDDERFSGNTEFDPKRDGAFDHLELRWDSVQTAVPPSVHPDTGDRYEFYRKRPERAPWEVSPDEVEEAIRAVAHRSQPTTSNGKSLDVPETIPEGKRNNALTSVAGTLRDRGLTVDEMEEMLQTVNENRCSPTLDPDEVRGIAHSVGRYDPTDPIANGQSEQTTEGDQWGAVRSTYESNTKQGRVEAAEEVLEDLHVATDRETGQAYVWDPNEKVLDASAEQRIGELLVQNLGKHHSQHERNEVTERVKLLTAQDGFGGEFIPVANGDLFLDGGSVQLKDADPDRAPLTRSNAAWDPNAECKCFKGHLQGVMPSERERETLQEYAGYCLLHWDIPFHKALFMVGPTASGKSTTLSVIRKLLGSVSKLSPQQLVNGRFGPAELEGAWANIRSDISAALLQDIGLFKEVVAGDPIFVERKYEQGYNIRPTAKHLYSANRLPDVAIDDDAFYRRILLVSFPTTIPREDRVNRSELDARLEQELDGVLRWAAEGLQRVLEQGGFTHDLDPQQTRHRWEEHASSIGRFKAAGLKITGDSNDVVAKEAVFSAYTQFCQDHGLGTETKRQLTRTLKRDPRITDGHRTPQGHSGQVRCYIGVQIDEDTE